MMIAKITASAFFEGKWSILLEGEKSKFALSYLDNVVPLCACIRFLNTSMFNQALCSKADWGSGKLEHDNATFWWNTEEEIISLRTSPLFT
jgi:hypothetical protein